MNSAIIGGSGFQGIIDQATQHIQVETPYGPVNVYKKEYGDNTIYILLRHEKGHTVPPHLINYRANIAALKELEVKQIIGLYGVGSITSMVLPGNLGLIDQFIDASYNRVSTFYNELSTPFEHTPMVYPYSRRLRVLIANKAKELNLPLSLKGTYLCTNGPRLETPAEITMYRRWGADYVGMTAATETILANEAHIEIAGLVYSMNWAAGLDAEGISFIEEDISIRATNQLISLAIETLK
ncbi:MAG: S-methyl-5'-thioadenosine phosphorylase [Spirochaetia bacterium]|nr:S-methyl-5'-thioadenosine phosphorylase [Spirochaetia bacterium]